VNKRSFQFATLRRWLQPVDEKVTAWGRWAKQDDEIPWPRLREQGGFDSKKRKKDAMQEQRNDGIKAPSLRKEITNKRQRIGSG
jgi:hypothetical protein